MVLTPGTDWYTDTARSADFQAVHDNLASHLAGCPRKVPTGPGAR
ncbi:hypothetical protein [Streptomyces sp. NPDC093261]